jgi:6-pyruvoyltetrahydropterin/6-carboxytetrahydropterin synthase
MKATICRKVHFNAAHRLHNPNWSDEKNNEIFGKCNNPNYHGHNYILEAKIQGKIDPNSGYVMDIKHLNDILEKEVIAVFDHRNLNLDTEEFKELNPTAENIARVIYDKVLPKIADDKKLKIILYETERNYVEYDGENY